MEIIPQPAAGKQLIQGYGGGGFRILQTRHEGSVLVLPDQTRPWAAASADEITADGLSFLFDSAPKILLIGYGPGFLPIPEDLRKAIKARGAVLEWMNTGAACRTFNVLLGEERSVAAALIAVS